MDTLRSFLVSYPFITPFITLSYRTTPPKNPDSFPDAHYYKTGLLDACLVVSWIAVLAVLREFFRLVILEPFARWWLTGRSEKEERKGAITPKKVAEIAPASLPAQLPKKGVRSRKKDQDVKLEKITKKRIKGMTKEQWLRERSVLRFAEQGWEFVYYTVYWCFGMYIHLSLPHSSFQLSLLWRDYPHNPIPGSVKFYYVSQFASWIHQVLILNAEARRKDHWQMMSHHVITIALMAASYFTNFTRIGCLIQFLMDWCDIWLPFAKMLRYLQLPTLCDAAFVVFLLSWFVTRHVLFGITIWSTYHDAPILVPFTWEPERGHFWNRDWYIIFVALLVALQLILCVWFWMICRIAWKVISGQPAEDTRSDEEGESPDEADEEDENGAANGHHLKPTSARDEPKIKAR